MRARFLRDQLRGAVFVPVNPVLKPMQVEHILNDCDVRVLITSPERLQHLQDVLPDCRSLHHVILSDAGSVPLDAGFTHSVWTSKVDVDAPAYEPPRRIDNDMVAILYTSGSTGRPKGVIISHRNIVEGARSVSEYLGIDQQDRILAVLSLQLRLRTQSVDYRRIAGCDLRAFRLSTA